MGLQLHSPGMQLAELTVRKDIDILAQAICNVWLVYYNLNIGLP